MAIAELGEDTVDLLPVGDHNGTRLDGFPVGTEVGSPPRSPPRAAFGSGQPCGRAPPRQ